MNDRDFIIRHCDSFIDNVLLDMDPTFWIDTLTDEEDGPGYLFDGLLSATKEWRHRIEANEAVKKAADNRANLYESIGDWWRQQNEDDEWQERHCGKD